MSILSALSGAAGAAGAVYVEDVFSTYLYTGNGGTQTITNGIDLSTKGGMVWIKHRGAAADHCIFDTIRGPNYVLQSSNTNQSNLANPSLTSFNADGFTLGTGGIAFRVNAPSGALASWTFRKQAKFFDIVTYTGTGSARTISHALGSTPGMIIVKRTNSTGGWITYHRSLGATKWLALNSTGTSNSSIGYWNNTEPTSSEFTLGNDLEVNASGATYVAYLFAHDAGGFGAAGTDSVVACGSFTADGSENATVSLGWEPQYILYKDASGSNSGNWRVVDNMRGLTKTSTGGSTESRLYPNASNAEGSFSDGININQTGFTATGLYPSTTYIYLAIRRGPMRTPTDATKVFGPTVYQSNATARTISAGVGPVDLLIQASRQTDGKYWLDRLRGQTKTLNSTATSSEGGTETFFDRNVGVGLNSANFNNGTFEQWASYHFRRAPGFFDVVCYTGTGSATTVAHNLGVAPELMIVKCRTSESTWWHTYIAPLGPTYNLYLQATNAASTAGSSWNNTSPTSSVFSISSGDDVNKLNDRFVAYLFATCPGVSKVGSYTGNGSSQTIDCGFASGARFVLIKRTDSTGDWYVWDTARGIVSGNDPRLSLNSTAAEVTTDDSIDPASSGFIVNQLSATNINVNGGTYIFLAIA